MLLLRNRIAALAAAALLGTGPVAAQVSSQLPKQLEGVEVTEKAGEKVDLGLTFTGMDGKQVALREFFREKRPVILTLVYYDCPMLCNRVLNGLTAALREIPWTPGKEYDIVTISIDPAETFPLARQRRQAYLAGFDRPAPGWHFLVDDRGSVARLAEQVGFGYRYDELRREYAHPAAIMVLSPDGTVSRYLYGIKFNPRDVRFAITEATDFRFAFTLDRLLLFCYHYDPSERSYVPFAMNIMRLGGVLTVFALGFWIWRFWKKENAAPV